MDLKKTTFYLFTLFSLMLISCSNDDENKNDAQVTVTVVSADGKPLPNEIVQMFDEKTYEEFKKDNRTTPTAYVLTNSTGVATFIFTYDKWFESNKDRFFTFAVQYGSGTENYEIWSAGRTVRPGSVTQIELTYKTAFLILSSVDSLFYRYRTTQDRNHIS